MITSDPDYHGEPHAHHRFVSGYCQFLLFCFCCYFNLQFTFLMSSNEDGHFLMFMFSQAGQSKAAFLLSASEMIENSTYRCYGCIRTDGSIRIIRGLFTPIALSEASVPASVPTPSVWPLYFHRKVPDSGGQSQGAPTIVGWRGSSAAAAPCGCFSEAEKKLLLRDCAGLPTASSTRTDTAGSSAYSTHSYTHTHTLNLERASARRVPG